MVNFFAIIFNLFRLKNVYCNVWNILSPIVNEQLLLTNDLLMKKTLEQ